MELKRSSKTLPIAVVVVALTVFLGHYSLAHAFGLYEDDYYFIAPHLAQRPADLWPILVDSFTTWLQGRPLGLFLPPMLAVLGSRLGGLQGVYALAAVWLTLNAMLVFLVVRRLLSPVAALTAAVAYVVFPANSTKALLVHAAHVQGAMTFLLLGTWLWLRGGLARSASYPVAALALLAYETAFLPFLVVPLLAPARWCRLASTWIRHAGACVLPVGLIGGLRIALGESRVLGAAADRGQTLWRSFSSLGIGPWTSGGMLLRSIPLAWRGADRHGVLSAIVFAGAMTLALAAVAGAPSSAKASEQTVVRDPLGQAEANRALGWTAVLVAGLVSWSLSYALTLVNYPPTQTIGRLTSTHVAGGWGVALLLGALVDGARQHWPRLTSVAVVTFLASWLLYQHGIQRQFAQAWSLQRSFWRQVLSLVPEARGGWTVLVEGTPLVGPPAILVNSWADILAYRALVTPERISSDMAASTSREGTPSPVNFAHLGRIGDRLNFRRQGERLEWQPEFWRGPIVSIDPDRLALLHDDRGVLTRVETIDTRFGVFRSGAKIPPPGAGRPAPGPVGGLVFAPTQAGECEAGCARASGRE